MVASRQPKWVLVTAPAPVGFPGEATPALGGSSLTHLREPGPEQTEVRPRCVRVPWAWVRPMCALQSSVLGTAPPTGGGAQVFLTARTGSRGPQLLKGGLLVSLGQMDGVAWVHPIKPSRRESVSFCSLAWQGCSLCRHEVNAKTFTGRKWGWRKEGACIYQATCGHHRLVPALGTSLPS